MQSKKSFFSKIIFQKNATRFAPIWIVYLLICLYQLPLQLYLNLGISNPNLTDSQLQDMLLTQLMSTVMGGLQPLLFFGFAIITAVALFSYLYQARSANMIHAFPVCREGLFLTNVLSGLCFLIIPQILSFLAGIFVCFLRHMTHLEYLMHWLLLSTGMVIFAFALAVFAVMITGNLVAAPIFYVVVNFLYVLCRNNAGWFVEELTYGLKNLSLTTGDILSPFYLLNENFGSFFNSLFYGETAIWDLSSAYRWIGGYFLVSFPLLFLAYLVYRHKQLESAGDILTVSFVSPILRWTLSFCLGSWIVQFLYNEFFPWEYCSIHWLALLIPTLFFCSVIFFLVEMLLKKRILVFHKKRLLECGVLCLCITGFLAANAANLFGLEQKIPEIDSIEKIYFYGVYPLSVEPEDFQRVQEIHQSLINTKDEFESYFKKYKDDSNYSELILTYTLTNGRTLKRNYLIPVEDYYQNMEKDPFRLIQELSHDEDYYLRYHFTDAYSSVVLVDGTLDVYSLNGYLEYASLDQAQCQILYQAFLQDLQEGNYRIYDYNQYENHLDTIYYNSLYLTYYVPKGSTFVSYDGESMVTSDRELQGTTITLTTQCVHTLAALEELGMVDEEHRLVTQEEANILFDMEASETIDAEVYH